MRTGGRAYRQNIGFKQLIRERDNNTCQNCGRTTDGQGVRQMDVAHIIPYDKGGLTTTDNMRLLCHSCNQLEREGSRKVQTPVEYMDDYFASIAAQLQAEQ